MFKLITKNVPGVGSFGELHFNGEKIAVSVERDWQNNQKNVSCIPEGRYVLHWHNSPKFGLVVALSNKNMGITVQGQSHRTHVYFHVANWPEQLQGCIALGTRFHEQTWGVANSTKATKEFYDLVRANPAAELIIERSL